MSWDLLLWYVDCLLHRKFINESLSTVVDTVLLGRAGLPPPTFLHSEPIIFSSTLREDKEISRNFASEGGVDLFSARLRGRIESRFSTRPGSPQPMCSMRPNPGHSPMTRRLQSGFTLLELAVVMVVATVILSITIPKIELFLDDYRLTASADRSGHHDPGGTSWLVSSRMSILK